MGLFFHLIHIPFKPIYFLHLFSFKTPILVGKKIRKNVKSIVGISPTMVLLFPLSFYYLKRYIKVFDKWIK